MKKSILIISAGMLALTSCTITQMTAHTELIGPKIETHVVADLQVSPTKIQYEYRPTSRTNKTSVANVVNAAVQEALTKNGNADVLVEMNYFVDCHYGLFGKSFTKVTVTGFPAYYKNFRSLTSDIPAHSMPISDPLPAQPSQPTATTTQVTVNNTAAVSETNKYTADEYYLAYLVKENKFNAAYRDELKQKYDINNIYALMNEHSSNQLLKMSKGHSEDLVNYKK